LIADDTIKNEAEAYSDVIMGNVLTALTSDAKNAMRARNTQFVVINTPFHKRDPIYMMIESGGFTPLVAPICKYINEYTTKEEFIGVWEDMHSYYSVMDRYLDAVGTNTTRNFNQELMLRVSNEEDRLVPDELIQWYNRDLVLKMLDGYSLYITTDYTTTSEVASDFAVVMTWAVSSNSDCFLLDACVRKMDMDTMYNETFKQVTTWGKGRPIEVGVETNGQQKAHIFTLKKMMQEKNRYFSFARQLGAPTGKEGIQSLGKKHDRFRYVVPWFQNRKMWFPEQLKNTADMKEILKQLKGVTQSGFSGHDDACDGISQLGLIDIIPGSGDGISTDDSFDKVNDTFWGNPFDKEEVTGGSTIF
jgi:predicted phage terminase large subunit-like protein